MDWTIFTAESTKVKEGPVGPVANLQRGHWDHWIIGDLQYEPIRTNHRLTPIKIMNHQAIIKLQEGTSGYI